jgi:hypothetical protein
MQLISHLYFSRWWYTVLIGKLSTIKVLDKWESCVFYKNTSEVLLVYDTEEEAIVGHTKLAKQLGMKNIEINDGC